MLSKTLTVPLKQFLNSLLNLNLMSPAKAMQFLHIDEFTHGSIRFRGIKFHLTLKSDSLNHKFREFTDCQFLTCTYIDMAISYFTPITIIPASTAMNMLSNVPASTYSVLAVSFSLKRMIDFAAINKPSAS